MQKCLQRNVFTFVSYVSPAVFQGIQKEKKVEDYNFHNSRRFMEMTVAPEASDWKPWVSHFLLCLAFREPWKPSTKAESLNQTSFWPWKNTPMYLRLVIASFLTDHSSMILIGLACSTCLIVVRSSHFTDSNRLQRRIKMQSLDIDHQQSTPLAKLMRQCIWINSAFLQLTHPSFLSLRPKCCCL